MLGASLLASCAGRAEPPASPAGEKSTHAFVAGEEPAVQAMCASLAEADDRRACEVIAGGRRFDTEAVAVCAEAPEPARALRCLRTIAERHFTERSLRTCRSLAGDERNECLEVLADRRLSDTQVAECLAEGEPRAVVRCLRRAHDFALDLELLAAAARSVAEQPPALEPVPESSTGEPIPEAAVLEARERVRRHNHAQIEDMMTRMRAAVEDAFPSLPLVSTEHDNVFNFAGAVAGHYRMLYCSRREYLIVFGTPIGTHGYSGRYEVDVHDWTLTGRMWIHRVGDYAPTIFDPGSWARLMANDSKIYAAAPSTYMLEHARGRISSAFDFGITAPARNVSRDFYNMRKQIRSCLDGALQRDLAQVRRLRRLEERGRRVRREVNRDLRAEGLAGRLR